MMGLTDFRRSNFMRYAVPSPRLSINSILVMGTPFTRRLCPPDTRGVRTRRYPPMSPKMAAWIYLAAAYLKGWLNLRARCPNMHSVSQA